MDITYKISPYIFVGLPSNIRRLSLDGHKIENFKEEMVISLLQNACSLTGCNYEDLNNGRRYAEIVKAKRLFCHYLREYTNNSLEKIGSYINGHHSTVLHHIKTCKDFIEIKDQEYLYLTNEYRKINRNIMAY